MTDLYQHRKDIFLILIASFFYMTSPMLVTPIITGFSETLGAGGTMMGIIGGVMNICSLISRPIVGIYSDRISKYKISSFYNAVPFFGTKNLFISTFSSLSSAIFLSIPPPNPVRLPFAPTTL